MRRDAPTDVAADSRSIDAGIDADTTAPALKTSFPGNGATGIARTTPVNVTFTEPVTHVDGGSFLLKQGSTMVSSGVSMSNPTDYVLTPTATLPANTSFTVVLSSGIVDLSNNPFAGTSFSFTTGP